jgi:hypothetical protein
MSGGSGGFLKHYALTRLEDIMDGIDKVLFAMIGEHNYYVGRYLNAKTEEERNLYLSHTKEWENAIEKRKQYIAASAA